MILRCVDEDNIMKKNQGNMDFKKLSEVAVINMGQSPPGDSYNESNDGIPFFQGKSEFQERYPIVKKWTTQPKKFANIGDILMSVRAPVGAVNFSNIKCCIGRGLAAITCTNINQEYLYFYFNFISEELENNGTGSTFKAITKNQLQNVQIPVPPIESQNKIVEILEKAEKLKTYREKADKFTEDYLKSIFLEMFGNIGKNDKNWEIVQIKDLVLKTYNENPKNEYPEEHLDYIDISSIDSSVGKIISSTKYLGKKAPSRARQKIKANDLLISTVRPNLNAVGLVPSKFDNQIASTGFCVLRANESVIPEYLFSISRSEYFIQSLVNQCKGASYPAVNNGDILNLKIPLPPIELQNKFAKIVERVEKIKEYQNQSKIEIDNLFNNLMQKAFKGEILI